MSSDHYGAQAGDLADQGAAGDLDDWEPCDHDCDEECDPCRHQHCWHCGGCGCPGYCDDYQTYNLRDIVEVEDGPGGGGG